MRLDFACVALVSALTACGGGSADGAPSAGVVWTVNTDMQSVSRTDLDTEETIQLDLASQPEHIAIFGASAWVTTDDGKLLKIDLHSRTIDQTIELGSPAKTIVAGPSGVFVADDGDGSETEPPKVRRLNPTSGAVESSVSVGDFIDRYHELALGPDGLYLEVDNGFAIARLDPASGAVEESLPLGLSGGYGYGELAFDGQDVWIADQYSNVLYRLSANPLVKQAGYPIEPRFDGEMTAGAGRVFIADTDAETIGVFDAKTGKLSQEFDAGVVRSMVVRNSTLVIALSYESGGDLRLVSPESGSVLRSLPGIYGDEIAFE